MGAVPKNKVTSVERGKRRAGQAQQRNLKRDKTHASAPMSKRGLVAQMFSRMGLEFKKIISQ